MIRSFLCLLVIVFEATLFAQPFEIPAKTTQFPDGRIVFPRSEATTGPDSSLSWKYKPSRWGMYEIVLAYQSDTAGPKNVRIEIVGQQFQNESGVRETSQEFSFFPIHRFYLAKSDPFEVRVTSASAGSISNLKAVLLRPAPEGKPIVQDSGEIVLHSRDATTHSVMTRYEPATNKLCLGYWTNPNDTASWDFEVTKPGTYEIELWQGCGKGLGGSTVAVRVLRPSQAGVSSDGSVLKEATFVVEDTGHFQNFIPRNLGPVTFREKGNYVFSVVPQNKKAAAVMDIRQIVLKPGKSN